MKIRKSHCLFEQSGTFKNEFIKLGIPAEDYDICNDFQETNNVIDLFSEIENAYQGGVSIFDTFQSEDIVMAFFPCIRFENQIYMHFQGTAKQYKNYSQKEKLLVDIKLHKELHKMYELISKMTIVCIDKGLRLIIENPYSTEHYLTRYWGIKPGWIDYNRRDRGDYQVKPTQYWFINCEPENNLILEAQVIQEQYNTHNSHRGSKHERTVKRSMIAKEYAERFIKEFILDGQQE